MRRQQQRRWVAAPDNSGGSVNALAAATGGLPLHSADSSYGSITALRRQQRWRVATPQDTAAMASSPCVGGSSDGVLPRRRRWQRRQRRCVDASNDGRLPRHREAAMTVVCRAAAQTAATKASPRFDGKGDGGLPRHRRWQRRYRRHASAVAVAEGRHVAGDGSVGSSNNGGLLRRIGVSSDGSVAALWLQQRQRDAKAQEMTVTTLPPRVCGSINIGSLRQR